MEITTDAKTEEADISGIFFLSHRTDLELFRPAEFHTLLVKGQLVTQQKILAPFQFVDGRYPPQGVVLTPEDLKTLREHPLRVKCYTEYVPRPLPDDVLRLSDAEAEIARLREQVESLQARHVGERLDQFEKTTKGFRVLDAIAGVMPPPSDELAPSGTDLGPTEPGLIGADESIPGIRLYTRIEGITTKLQAVEALSKLGVDVSEIPAKVSKERLIEIAASRGYTFPAYDPAITLPPVDGE